MLFVVTAEQEGKLLRDFLRGDCCMSRKTLCALKQKENGILLNGRSVTVRAVLSAGDKVEAAIEDREQDENPNVVPVGEMPDIIYEDDAVIAVNKPCGMPTHTSFGHYEDALSNAVCAYLKGKGQPFVFRAINRLDRDTSGVVLIAKNKYYASILSKSLEKGSFEKKYIAVVHGKTEPCGRIEGYIEREGESIIKRRFLTEKTEASDYSLTEYKTLSSSENASLLKLSPITGRTHQLRVHMAHIGHPIFGDNMYCYENDGISRQALHAYTLTFPSPINGEKIKAIAEIPSDIKELAGKHSLKIEELDEN